MSLAYFEHGQGKPLVLLHGYLEQKEMWQETTALAPGGIRMICPDMPGHGKSPAQKNQTIESMGKAVVELADSLGIENFSLAGHSMGGYVALAIAEKHPGRIENLILLHSHPFADPSEKVKNRISEIKLLENGKKDMLIRMSVPNLFANDFAAEHPEIVQDMVSKALTTPAVGMAACLLAMAKRPDRNTVPENSHYNTMFILGKKDNLIPWQNVFSRYNPNHTRSRSASECTPCHSPEASDCGSIKFVLLEKAGHMGMIEEKELFCKSLFDFID